MARPLLARWSRTTEGVQCRCAVDLEIADEEFVVSSGRPAAANRRPAHDRRVGGHHRRRNLDRRKADQRRSATRPDIAMVFQSYALYPHMNVEDNMSFGLKLRAWSAARSRREFSVHRVTLGLETFLNRLPKALSGGQRQRVASGARHCSRAGSASVR